MSPFVKFLNVIPLVSTATRIPLPPVVYVITLPLVVVTVSFSVVKEISPCVKVEVVPSDAIVNADFRALYFFSLT